MRSTSTVPCRPQLCGGGSTPILKINKHKIHNKATTRFGLDNYRRSAGCSNNKPNILDVSTASLVTTAGQQEPPSLLLPALLPPNHPPARSLRPLKLHYRLRTPRRSRALRSCRSSYSSYNRTKPCGSSWHIFGPPPCSGRRAGPTSKPSFPLLMRGSSS